MRLVASVRPSRESSNESGYSPFDFSNHCSAILMKRLKSTLSCWAKSSTYAVMLSSSMLSTITRYLSRRCSSMLSMFKFPRSDTCSMINDGIFRLLILCFLSVTHLLFTGPGCHKPLLFPLHSFFTSPKKRAKISSTSQILILKKPP